MTKNDRLKAFSMRLEGYSWQEIGRAIGYTGNTVRQDLTACLMVTPRQVRCAYPVIRRIIEDKYDCNIKTFAAACGMSDGAMRYTLSGQNLVPKKRKDAICSVIGIPPETAFRTEEDGNVPV